MGLYRRGSVWWMSFTANGKRYRGATETEDRKLARRILDKVKVEIAEGKWFEKLPGETKTLKESIDKYLERSSGKATRSRYNDKGGTYQITSRFLQCRRKEDSKEETLGYLS